MNGKYVAQPWQLTAKLVNTYTLHTFPYEGKVPETRSVEGGKGTKMENWVKWKLVESLNRDGGCAQKPTPALPAKFAGRGPQYCGTA